MSVAVDASIDPLRASSIVSASSGRRVIYNAAEGCTSIDPAPDASRAVPVSGGVLSPIGAVPMDDVSPAPGITTLTDNRRLRPTNILTIMCNAISLAEESIQN